METEIGCTIAKRTLEKNKVGQIVLADFKT
jgi:hypothetical protein